MKREQLKLYLVTDRRIAGRRDICDIVERAVRGGVTMVQLREKSVPTRAFLEVALRLKSALEGTAVPLIINDRIDIALACEADGVHIGQSDMPFCEARRILGEGRIIGLSVENMTQVVESNALDVDYIGISPVFGTQTKTDTAAPFGLDGLREAVRLSAHPTVAIGGMNSATVAEVARTGVDGVAVVSAIVGAADPCEASGSILSLFNENAGR